MIAGLKWLEERMECVRFGKYLSQIVCLKSGTWREKYLDNDVSSNYFFQNDVPGMLAYSLKLCMSLMQNKQFRNKVLRVLVKIYMNLEKPDFINVCQVITLYYFTLCCWVMPHYLMCVPHYITIISYIYLSVDLYNSPVKIRRVFMFCFTD